MCHVHGALRLLAGMGTRQPTTDPCDTCHGSQPHSVGRRTGLYRWSNAMKFLYIPLHLRLSHVTQLIRHELMNQEVLAVRVKPSYVVVEYKAEKDSINRDNLVV